MKKRVYIVELLVPEQVNNFEIQACLAGAIRFPEDTFKVISIKPKRPNERNTRTKDQISTEGRTWL